ncbi:MAG: type II toxin-antitoxin system Phd/YefM family antitoxin [Chloroflexota bacterium]|nr:type II toxin-antitoxin system Phd/YefM family antitoxin [Chloroflexota bacterium]
MLQLKPPTNTMTLAEVKQSLPRVLEEASRSGARVIVEDHGEPVAAIISIEDWRRFARLEAEREKRFAVLDQARAAFAGVPAEEIEEAAIQAIARVRASAKTRDANE